MIFVSLSVLALLPAALAVGSPGGFGTSTTGGGSAAAQTPGSSAELLSWLADSTARTIVLDKIYDFTNYWGTQTGEICKPWTCSNGNQPQSAINSINWCSASYPKSQATYYKSGTTNSYYLKVASNKTLLGKGKNAGIKGTGVYIYNAENVIIQNIAITDINAQYVWGGDAISIIKSKRVWIDHNYVARIGRQFVVTGFEPAQQVTISNNYFDGRSTWSASCNGQHYWAFLFAGNGDSITLANNHIYQTSGRGPHIGGTSGYTQQIHIVNNYYNNVQGHALDADVGSVALLEGNYFNSVTTPDTANANGGVFFIQTVDEARTCGSAIGRNCEWNRFSGSGTVKTHIVTSVVNTLKSQSAVKNWIPKAVADVPAYVQANAGVGIVN